MMNSENPVITRMNEIVRQMDSLNREADALLDAYVEAVCAPTPSDERLRTALNLARRASH
jgi:hypothetical protein